MCSDSGRNKAGDWRPEAGGLRQSAMRSYPHLNRTPNRNRDSRIRPGRAPRLPSPLRHSAPPPEGNMSLKIAFATRASRENSCPSPRAPRSSRRAAHLLQPIGCFPKKRKGDNSTTCPPCPSCPPSSAGGPRAPTRTPWPPWHPWRPCLAPRVRRPSAAHQRAPAMTRLLSSQFLRAAGQKSPEFCLPAAGRSFVISRTGPRPQRTKLRTFVRSNVFSGADKSRASLPAPRSSPLDSRSSILSPPITPRSKPT
jgi:hypothetical protein